MKKLIGVFFLTVLWSCGSNTAPLEQALELAGENRQELEKVLVHYQDSGLKYDAACFLIKNMIGCHGADTMAQEQLRTVYAAYDEISRNSDYQMDEIWGERIDSLVNRYSHLFFSTSVAMDVQHIKADYLIREIDRSFQAWKMNVYASDASFENFCEYVLPYRRLNGLVADNARDIFFERHGGEYYKVKNRHWLDETDSLLYEYRHLTHSGFRGTRIPILRAETFELLRHGLCVHRCWYNSLLLSSLGMPVAVDFVPAWGNRNNSHTWNVVLLNGDSFAFEAFWDYDRWKYKRIYNNRNIDHLWGKFRLPKVYRYTYSNHLEGPITDSDVVLEDIPSLFRNIKKKDVSEEYFEPHDVTIKLEKTAPEGARYAYLAVFGYQEWHPVQWGRLTDDGTVTFRGMGKDIVYLPVYYRYGRTIPAGAPFKLEANGTICQLGDDGDKERICLRIIKGAPVCDANRVNFDRPRGMRCVGLKNGCPEEVLLEWRDSLTLGYSESKITTDSSYRFVRLYLRDDTLSLGEISFHTQDGTIPSVRVLTKVKAFLQHEGAEMLSDGVEATVCNGLVPQKYVDFDLGKEHKLTAIGLYPYLNSEVIEGVFELMCWTEGGWQSLGQQEADGRGYLTFDDVPTGRLLMLKKHGRGWEAHSGERTFIYRKGGHICWE